MWTMGRFFRSIAVLLLLLACTEAPAQDLPCGSFRRGIGGAWSAVRPATFQGPYGQISVRRGRTFDRGSYYRGLDVAALLEQQCRLGPPPSRQAFAQELRCGSFRRNPLGSWSATRPVTLRGPYGKISVGRGRTFNRGVYYKGLDLVALLEQRCR
jgi:hypothetical protein